MDIEWEAKFINVDKDEVRERLRNSGAVLVKHEQLYRRAVFLLPSGHEIQGGWVRVRDEGDKITMSLKVVTNGSVELQKEVQLVVDNYDNARLLLTEIGCVEKAYQESNRELWKIGDVEITIDEWPYLEPYVEIEGKSEDAIKAVSSQLGFDYGKALFGAVDQVISLRYGIPESAINNEISRIVFGEPNPYLAWKEKSGVKK